MSWDAAPGIGFGCCPMGGHGWGKVDEQQLVDAVHTALDLGIQLFDTADVYGLGASETILGRALAGRRHEAVIATKFGVRYEHGKSRYDNSRTWILQAAEASLRRLHVDVIDLYQMHYWDGTTPLPEIVGTLQDLTVAGKIRAWGITNHSPTDAALSQSGLRCKTYSFQYSLVQRQAEREILAHQHAGRQVFLGWGSLGQGILSGKYQDLSQLDPTDRRHREVYANFHGDRFAAVQRLLAGMQTIAAEIGVATLSQLALRWVIDRIPRSIALVGIKRPEQIRDAAGSLDFRLEPAVLARLDALSADFESAPRQR
ncbi:MAG: aldo/keto reductase [Opitutaceae bacterium]|nr:aldo/keto reductase [Opitutaceae bacterium]